jgi:hypothetical protein
MALARHTSAKKRRVFTLVPSSCRSNTAHQLRGARSCTMILGGRPAAETTAYHAAPRLQPPLVCCMRLLDGTLALCTMGCHATPLPETCDPCHRDRSANMIRQWPRDRAHSTLFRTRSRRPFNTAHQLRGARSCTMILGGRPAAETTACHAAPRLQPPLVCCMRLPDGTLALCTMGCHATPLPGTCDPCHRDRSANMLRQWPRDRAHSTLFRIRSRRPFNTGDKLRASITLSARLLHLMGWTPPTT